MKNLFTLDDLSEQEIHHILQEAETFKKGKTYDKLVGKKAANLFFEPSTRTHYSFVAAQQKFGMQVTNFNVEKSSIKKGESLYDTVKTFEMLGFDCLVIRHPQTNYFLELDNVSIPILSGGDGTGSHPTQSLLDLMTIKEEFKQFKGLKIAFIGDIMHSRVAHTNIKVMKRLGLECYVVDPFGLGAVEEKSIDIEEAIKEMDILMFLRIQFERHGYDLSVNPQTYHKEYGMTKERVQAMKDHAIIMHPAPYNRGVELSDYAVECEKSRIMKQMENGVYIRMAVLKEVFNHEPN